MWLSSLINISTTLLQLMRKILFLLPVMCFDCHHPFAKSHCSNRYLTHCSYLQFWSIQILFSNNFNSVCLNVILQKKINRISVMRNSIIRAQSLTSKMACLSYPFRNFNKKIQILGYRLELKTESQILSNTIDQREI